MVHGRCSHRGAAELVVMQKKTLQALEARCRRASTECEASRHILEALQMWPVLSSASAPLDRSKQAIRRLLTAPLASQLPSLFLGVTQRHLLSQTSKLSGVKAADAKRILFEMAELYEGAASGDSSDGPSDWACSEEDTERVHNSRPVPGRHFWKKAHPMGGTAASCSGAAVSANAGR